MERGPSGDPAATAPRPPRYRWTILGLASGAQASTAALFQGLPALGPALALAYGLSLSQVGVALGSVIFGMTLTLLPWGLAADRLGERWVVPVGLAGTALALAAVALAETYLALVAGLFVAGLWAANANAATGRAVVRWFEASERGFALGARQAAIPLGGALGAASLPLLASAGGVEAAFLGLAGLTAAAGAATALWLRDPGGDGAAAATARHIALALRNRALWRLVAVTLLLVASQYAFIGFLALFLSDARGVPPERAALALVALQLAGAVARVAVGRWSDRVGSRTKPLRSIAAAAAVGLLVVGALADAPAALLAPAMAAAALPAVSWNALAFAAGAELAPQGTSGTAIGLQNTALALGAAAFLPLFGLLVDATSWGLAFAAAAVFPLSALLLLRGLRA